MTLKERWEAEETKIGTFLKTVIGYLGMFGSVSLEIATNYLTVAKDYVPDTVIHGMFTVGIIGYGIGKLTAKKPE